MRYFEIIGKIFVVGFLGFILYLSFVGGYLVCAVWPWYEVLSIFLMLLSVLLIKKDTWLRSKEIWLWLICCFTAGEIRIIQRLYKCWDSYASLSYYEYELVKYTLLLLILIVIKNKFDKKIIKSRNFLRILVIVMAIVTITPAVSWWSLDDIKFFLDSDRFEGSKAIFVGDSDSFVRASDGTVYFHSQSNGCKKIGELSQSMAVSTDGTKIAGTVKQSDDKNAIAFDILDIPTGQRLSFKRETPSVGVFPAVDKVVFSPDGRYLASLVGFATIEIWDVATGTIRHRYRYNDLFNKEGSKIGAGPLLKTIVFSADGNSLFFGGEGGNIYAIDVSSGNAEVILKSNLNTIMRLVLAPEGDVMYALVYKKDVGKCVEIWDVQKRQMVFTVKGIRDKADINSLSIAQKAKRLAVTGDSGDQIWDTTNPSSPVLVCEREAEPPGKIHNSSISIRSDGKQILTTTFGEDGNRVVRWNVKD